MPGWFLGYDVALHLAFAIITLIVSIFAFKIYRLSGQRQPRLFATAFFFVSMAYLLNAMLHFLMLSKLNDNVCSAFKLASAAMLELMGTYFYIALFSIGLITLAYMTLRVRSAKAYSLLIIIVLISFFFTTEPLQLYHLLSSILIVYIIIHYLINFLSKKKTNALLMLAAFALLLFGNIHFLFSITESERYYVIAHLFELMAYLFILSNLILVQRHEQKTRPASNRS
jgi:hypothetical protein